MLQGLSGTLRSSRSCEVWSPDDAGAGRPEPRWTRHTLPVPAGLLLGGHRQELSAPHVAAPAALIMVAVPDRRLGRHANRGHDPGLFPDKHKCVLTSPDGFVRRFDALL